MARADVALKALFLIGMMAVADADRALLQSGNLLAIVSGNIIASSGDGKWAAPSLGAGYATVNPALAAAVSFSGAGSTPPAPGVAPTLSPACGALRSYPGESSGSAVEFGALVSACKTSCLLSDNDGGILAYNMSNSNCLYVCGAAGLGAAPYCTSTLAGNGGLPCASPGNCFAIGWCPLSFNSTLALYSSGACVYDRHRSLLSVEKATAGRSLLSMTVPSSFYTASFARFGAGVTGMATAGKSVVFTGASSGGATPNILLSTDAGLTFMAVTGLPTFANADATSTGLGATLAAANLPYPPTYAPDLPAVIFTSSTMGIAVGGIVTLAAPVPSSTAIGTGAIMITTNGGTVWSSVKLFPTAADIAAAYGISGAAGAALYSQPVPGALFSVFATSSGKYVFAVGAPPYVATSTGSLSAPVTGTDTITYTQQVFPTILYSGNGGMSWNMQTAPALYGGTAYALQSVYTMMGSKAVAVGGGLLMTSTPGQFGTILYTTNGGFSWKLASYFGNTGLAPVFTTVTFTEKTRVGWVGGFARQDDYYPSKAAGSYSVLTSVDGGATWTSPAASTFPAGFVITGSGAPTAFNNVFGIAWVDAQNGFMYGSKINGVTTASTTGFIYRTRNAGQTWVDETPNSITVGAGAGPVYNLIV